MMMKKLIVYICIRIIMKVKKLMKKARLFAENLLSFTVDSPDAAVFAAVDGASEALPDRERMTPRYIKQH